MPLPDSLHTAVLRRLGFWEPPAPTFETLVLLYAAWCGGVPFDNLRKLNALYGKTEGPLPGIEPVEFFETWLEHGVGGTCWVTAGALAALLEGVGFTVIRATASMFDMGSPNHGTTLVELDGQAWLVDSSMLTGEPIPLTPGVYGDILRVEVEDDAQGTRVWFSSGSQAELVPCRLLERGVEQATFAELYEASRGAGPFNTALYFRRNLPDRVVVLRGHQKHVLDVTGVSTWELNEAELRKTLGKFGVSAAVEDAFEQSGALKATLEAEPHAARAFPEPPPSKR